MAFTENLNEFLSTDDFAVEATFTPSAGDAATIRGIFDAEFVAIDPGGSVGVSTAAPMFQARTVDVTNAYGGTLAVNSTTYDIIEVRPDGTGMTTLILQEAA